MGMAADELGVSLPGDIIHGHRFGFTEDLRAEAGHEQQVGQFFPRPGGIFGQGGVDQFSGLVHEVARRVMKSLFPVPGASAGGAEGVDGGQKFLEVAGHGNPFRNS